MGGDGTGSSKHKTNERSSPDVSIILPCFNGERYLDETLRAIFDQNTALRFEVIAIDSGSIDRTLQILSNYPVTTHRIPTEEFGHGKTRNLGARLASGRFVIFLTQDATPAHETWLQNLVAPLLEEPEVAGAYSRQLPREDCNPVERRDIESGAGPITMIKRVNFDDPYQERTYREYRNLFMLFSNVSACVRRDVLRHVPFNEELPMVEDQEWCKRIIEKGYSVIYDAASAVYHSHNHTLRQIYARHRDYGASYRVFVDFSIDFRKIFVYVLRESFLDIIFVLRPRGLLWWRVKWMFKAPLVRFAMRYGLRRGLMLKT